MSTLELALLDKILKMATNEKVARGSKGEKETEDDPLPIPLGAAIYGYHHGLASIGHRILERAYGRRLLQHGVAAPDYTEFVPALEDRHGAALVQKLLVDCNEARRVHELLEGGCEVRLSRLMHVNLMHVTKLWFFSHLSCHRRVGKQLSATISDVGTDASAAWTCLME
jgi:hypothetical protein